MIRYKDKKPLESQNTTISAVLSLAHYQPGKIMTDTAIAQRARILGREPTADDPRRNASRSDARYLSDPPPILRVIVHENPYARIPLRRDLFTGAYDERYGPDGEDITRLFVGAEIAKLEAQLASVQDSH